MKKRVISLIILLSAVFIFTGCWDRKELNELGIVMAIGLDRNAETGEINLISQVVRPSELKKQGGDGKEAPYEIVTTSNKSVFEAIRDTITRFDRRSIFSHVKVIVIGESLAREGLNDAIDFISRSHEIRSFTWLVIAKDSEAKDILTVKHGIDKVQANYMAGIIEREKKDAVATNTNFVEFIQKIPGEGIHPVTGAFILSEETNIIPQKKEPERGKSLVLFGTAAFKKDKLVGFLSKNETIGFNLITQKKNTASIHVDSPINKDKSISIEIRKTDSKITPEIRDGKIFFNIKVYVEGNITEVHDRIDVSNVETFNRVNDKFTEYISNEVNITTKKIQKELKTDILGLGVAFQRKYPKEWNTVKDQWDTIFPETICDIKVETKLKRTGLLLKPFNTKKVEE